MLYKCNGKLVFLRFFYIIEPVLQDCYSNNISNKSHRARLPAVMSKKSAVWPIEGFPSANSALVLKLFSILDDSSPESGQRLVDEIFTSDGRMKNGMHSFSGKTGTSISA